MNFDKMYSKLTPIKLDKRKGVFSKIVLCDTDRPYEEGWILKINQGKDELFKARIGKVEFLQGLDHITDKFAQADSDCTAVELRHFLIKMYGLDKIIDKGLLIVWLRKIDN